MKKMNARIDQGFGSGADKYAAYLKTPEGRLRLDLAFANLQDFLPRSVGPLRALDLGAGTGAIAVRLGQLGFHVTLLDVSLPMLDFAKHAAQEAGLTDQITLKHGDAGQLANLFDGETFDLVLCHNVLEYVDDPCTVLRSAGRMLRGTSALISVLVRNQAGDVLKAAIQDGDLAASEHNLSAECGHESLYGGTVRLFTVAGLQSMIAAASLVATSERGVRVVSDYIPSGISRDAEYERIFDLERKLGMRPEFAAVARYRHCLAHGQG